MEAHIRAETGVMARIPIIASIEPLYIFELQTRTPQPIKRG